MNTLRERLGPRARKWLSIGGYAFGLTLMGAAVWLAFRGGDQDAIDAIRSAPVWAVILLGLLAIANALLVALSFLVLTRSFGQVTLHEMLALVGAAWLLNYLPMRPGLVGRVAYHKKFNNVHVKDSVRVLVVAAIGTVIAAVHLGLLAMMHFLVDSPAVLASVWVGSAIAVAIGAQLMFKRSVFARFETPRLWISLGLRYLDVAVWGARYWAASKVLGMAIGPVGCLFLAAASQVAFLVPFVGNGIGLRELTTGIATDTAGISSIEAGVQLELVNRAVEVLVAVPIGLLAIGWLAHRTRRTQRGARAEAATTMEI